MSFYANLGHIHTTNLFHLQYDGECDNFGCLGHCECGSSCIPVALAEIYRAHAFEKHFWDFIRKETSDIGKGKVEMSEPVTITP